MRTSLCAAMLMVIGCSDSGEPVDDTPAFEIQSTPFTLAPGEESTKCFYFTTSNLETVAVSKWVSDKSPGSHHMIMFRTFTGSQPPDGTIDEACGGDGVSVPVFGTQIPHEVVAFPSDDGNGKPLAQMMESQSKGLNSGTMSLDMDQCASFTPAVRASAGSTCECPRWNGTSL